MESYLQSNTFQAMEANRAVATPASRNGLSTRRTVKLWEYGARYCGPPFTFTSSSTRANAWAPSDGRKVQRTNLSQLPGWAVYFATRFITRVAAASTNATANGQPSISSGTINGLWGANITFSRVAGSKAAIVSAMLPLMLVAATVPYTPTTRAEHQLRKLPAETPSLIR